MTMDEIGEKKKMVANKELLLQNPRTKNEKNKIVGLLQLHCFLLIYFLLNLLKTFWRNFENLIAY